MIKGHAMIKLTQAQLEYLSALDELPEATTPLDRCSLVWIGGSHAYGIDVKESDVDVRIMTMPTMSQLLLQADYGERHMPDSDLAVRSFIKVAGMLCNANPNMVELVNLPVECVLHCDEYGFRLLQLAPKLALSTKCASTFAGYATQQIALAERREREGDLPRMHKARAHALRVLRMGATLLESGEVWVSRKGIDADELLSIRRGLYERGEYEALLENARHDFLRAESVTCLPEPVSVKEFRELVLPILREYAGHLFAEG